jgi:glycosyltransferase involved in cell wall biosynthesis
MTWVDHLGERDVRSVMRLDGLLGEADTLVALHHRTEFPAVAPADLPAPSSAPKLLAMGRLHPNKGFDVLLRAIALLPRGHLYLAGAGPEEAALRALAAELGITDRVSFLGWRRDIGALLAAADMFICSSRHEPLGNIVLEAWSAAKPVIAAAAQGPSELINDRADGLLVPRELKHLLREGPGLRLKSRAVLRQLELRPELRAMDFDRKA